MNANAMRVSEFIRLLQAEMKERGDLPISFVGLYGAEEVECEIIPIPAKQTAEKAEIEDYLKHPRIRIWTNICTG